MARGWLALNMMMMMMMMMMGYKPWGGDGLGLAGGSQVSPLEPNREI
jgi:hypothetical protein